MKKVRLGVIGCGGMMNFHLDRVLKMDDVEVVAVADPIEERRMKAAARANGARTYKDGLALYDGEKELDAIYIAVPPNCHIGLEEAALQRNLPFMVEKPMTLDPKQAAFIAEEVQKKNLITAVGFQDRYLDIIDIMKQELPKTQIGLIYGSWIGGVPGVHWWIKTSTGGGQLLEQNIHLVDMLRWLFGEVKMVYSSAGRGIITQEISPGYDTEDYSATTFTFTSGKVATLFTADFVSAEGTNIRNGLTVIGRDQSMEYELRESLKVMSKNKQTMYRRIKDQSWDLDRTFMDAVLSGDGSKIRSPYPDALKSLNLCFAANESMQTGKPVQI